MSNTPVSKESPEPLGAEFLESKKSTDTVDTQALMTGVVKVDEGFLLGIEETIKELNKILKDLRKSYEELLYLVSRKGLNKDQLKLKEKLFLECSNLGLKYRKIFSELELRREELGVGLKHEKSILLATEIFHLRDKIKLIEIENSDIDSFKFVLIKMKEKLTEIKPIHLYLSQALIDPENSDFQVKIGLRRFTSGVPTGIVLIYKKIAEFLSGKENLLKTLEGNLLNRKISVERVYEEREKFNQEMLDLLESIQKIAEDRLKPTPSLDRPKPIFSFRRDDSTKIFYQDLLKLRVENNQEIFKNISEVFKKLISSNLELEVSEESEELKGPKELKKLRELEKLKELNELRESKELKNLEETKQIKEVKQESLPKESILVEEEYLTFEQQKREEELELEEVLRQIEEEERALNQENFSVNIQHKFELPDGVFKSAETVRRKNEDVEDIEDVLKRKLVDLTPADENFSQKEEIAKQEREITKQKERLPKQKEEAAKYVMLSHLHSIMINSLRIFVDGKNFSSNANLPIGVGQIFYKIQKFLKERSEIIKEQLRGQYTNTIDDQLIRNLVKEIKDIAKIRNNTFVFWTRNPLTQYFYDQLITIKDGEEQSSEKILQEVCQVFENVEKKYTEEKQATASKTPIDINHAAEDKKSFNRGR